MDEISRLISAGMDRKCAERIVVWYESMCDGEGLEDFVSAIENGHEVCNV